MKKIPGHNSDEYILYYRQAKGENDGSTNDPIFSNGFLIYGREVKENV